MTFWQGKYRLKDKTLNVKLSKQKPSLRRKKPATIFSTSYINYVIVMVPPQACSVFMFFLTLWFSHFGREVGSEEFYYLFSGGGKACLLCWAWPFQRGVGAPGPFPWMQTCPGNGSFGSDALSLLVTSLWDFLQLLHLWSLFILRG